MSGTEIALRTIGAFYAFAGLVVVRVALSSRFLDQAIAALGAGKPEWRENAQTIWHLASALVVFGGGAMLMLLLEAAAWVFLLSAASQAAYLFWLAPRYFDPGDPPDATGRRQTTNAFVIYSAATALVCWAFLTGRLLAWRDVPWPLLAAAAAAMVALAGYAAWTYAKPVRSAAPEATDPPPARWGDGDERGATPSLPEISHVKVMAERGRYPLLAVGQDAYDDIAPEVLGLSPELCDDLRAWADAFDLSFDVGEPARSTWTEAQRRSHADAATPLALRLKRERPDLVVYVPAPDAGLREVGEA